MKDKPYTVEQEQIARFAKAMGHPARMAILAFLANQESCFFGDIHEVLPIAKATVSQHLKELKEAGLIQGENRNAKKYGIVSTGKIGNSHESYLLLFWGIANVKVHRAVNNSTFFFKIIVRSSTNYDYYINFKVELEMEIKVLGTGCSSCKALYETTKQAISELGCDATLIKEEDLLKIMEYNIFRSSGFGD